MNVPFENKIDFRLKLIIKRSTVCSCLICMFKSFFFVNKKWYSWKSPFQRMDFDPELPLQKSSHTISLSSPSILSSLRPPKSIPFCQILFLPSPLINTWVGFGGFSLWFSMADPELKMYYIFRRWTASFPRILRPRFEEEGLGPFPCFPSFWNSTSC